MDKKLMEKEYHQLEDSIDRLKKAEKELDVMKPPDNIFGSQLNSIMM